jgi:hypothetical protein
VVDSAIDLPTTLPSSTPNLTFCVFNFIVFLRGHDLSLAFASQSPVTDAVTATTPPVVMVDGCPDADCNGTYTAQPHKIVNGIPRYLKNHSFYYLYRTTTGHWMITWFEPGE